MELVYGRNAEEFGTEGVTGPWMLYLEITGHSTRSLEDQNDDRNADSKEQLVRFHEKKEVPLNVTIYQSLQYASVIKVWKAEFRSKELIYLVEEISRQYNL